jgi:ribonucleoside-triphosphate reductase (formate)
MKLDITSESKFSNMADTSVTIEGIKRSLKISLQERFPERDSDWINTRVRKILKTNGLHKENFNTMKLFNELITSQLNDVSIDDNSNKNEKSVASIHAEVMKPYQKAAGFDYLYRTMKELYGKKRAKYLTGRMYDYSLGISDSTNILLPYCYAINASRLVTDGRDFGVLESSPAKHVNSYVAQLNEQIHQMSNHFAGALAVGTFFIDIANILLMKHKTPISELRGDRQLRKSVTQHMQSFVHSMNSLSRFGGTESPFTNVSIFDRSKLRHIIKEDMAWYFSDEFIPFNSERIEYIVEYIIEIQNLFLDFFDKGDPLKNGRQYRFPVVTINLSKRATPEGDWRLTDQIMLEELTNKYNIKRYNIFCSEGTKVASCCRLVNDSDMLEMAAQSNSFGAGALSDLGSHRVVTPNFARPAYEARDYTEYLLEATKLLEEARDILIAHKHLIKHFDSIGLHMFIKNGWVNMQRLFSTIGVMGVYEADIILKEKFGDKDYTSDILTLVSDACKQYSGDTPDCTFNSEQIPGESYAVRLCEVDTLLYGKRAVPFNLYANQFVPLWEEVPSVYAKMDIDGKYNSLLTGGFINHIPFDGEITPSQARKLINYSVQVGSEHFALNGVYSECENGHNIDGDVDTCPICKGNIIEKYTRVVGFYTPVNHWNKVRREFDFENRVDYAKTEI